ncbi:MAG: hypothetical protein VX768_11455 [Planctomycetota bacterium]|nr:hypothetical protein [Planctomycetota bacterium]
MRKAVTNSSPFPGRSSRKSTYRKLLVLLVLVGMNYGSVATSIVNADEMGYVLLKSGKILQGTATEQRNQTRIEFPNGDYILIPSQNIEKSFEFRRDVFNYRSAITPLNETAQNHLLAWLVEQRNYERAREQLNALRGSGLKLDYSGWESVIDEKAEPALVKKRPTEKPFYHKKGFPSRVQQHLVLGCALSGCHRQSAENSLSFQFPDNLSDPHASKARFEEISQMIRRVGSVAFLKNTSGRHGNLKAPMYPKSTAEYLEIATWVNGAGFPRTALPRNGQHVRPVAAMSQTPASVPRIQPTRQSEQAEYRIKAAPVTDAARFRPRDEFDPEIFNRLQEEKSKSRNTTANRIQSAPQTPPRLISPESTAVRN